MSVRILIGDCTVRLKELPDNSVDSVVCDPPYHLVSQDKRDHRRASPSEKQRLKIKASTGFMGQTWDGGDVAFRPDTWAEALRVLKPGGMLAAFSGCRTYHRMACAIEDAGFEVREMLSWNFGSGFPKSRNVFKDLQASGNACSCPKTRLSSHHVSEQDVQRLREAVDAQEPLPGGAEQDLRAEVCGAPNIPQQGRDAVAIRSSSDGGVSDLRRASNSLAVSHSQDSAELLQRLLPVEDVCRPAAPVRGEHEGPQGKPTLRPSEPSLEGRRDTQAPEGELLRGPLCEGAGVGNPNGSEGPLHNGTPPGDGADVRLPIDANGSGEPQGSQPGEQSPEQPGAVAHERGSQAWGGWPVCGGCRKPIIPEGLGTALKPALEPICLARKPLSEKSVAANVLKWGTGAINVDACRIEHAEECKPMAAQAGGDKVFGQGGRKEATTDLKPNGRWPANVCLSYPADEYALRSTVTDDQRRELFGWLHANA